ncbi:MAG: NADH-quinone oxidoreductase subunit L, partial [Verrucomicrobia bacterium]|nr:NADH-quinone oxidoreductase subunit L [Verrucomicrobiota bacterium]
IGDFGMLLGILTLWGYTGTFDFKALETAVTTPGVVPPTVLAIAGLLVFCGAVGKSAQFPLHVWLPDAMEGPTPVSALIHAATMVAAGVYMLCRVAWLLVPEAALVVAWVGGITALMAAVIAIGQSDIKRILAYSTVSQLGYMVMAVGLGGPLQAMTHLTAHAFFKALLFLGAGSVIMALHHEQNIWKMGGLAKRMPFTCAAFVIGSLALAGIWPLSGFYTKDEILLLALAQQPVLFAMGLVAAFCTAFYMGRLLLVAFAGKARDAHLNEHAHEQGAVVLLPLALLAILSIGSGWHAMIPRALSPDVHVAHHPLWQEAMLLAVPVLGFVLAALLYRRAIPSDQPLRRVLGRGFNWLEHSFYIDNAYAWLIRLFYAPLATLCTRFDTQVLQGGIIRGAAAGAGWLAQCVRFLQNGDLRMYVFMFGFGVVLLIHFVGRQ